jgi:hypothetical protein
VTVQIIRARFKVHLPHWRSSANEPDLLRRGVKPSENPLSSVARERVGT